MSEEDKITNVVIRYRTEGAEQAAQTSQRYNATLAQTEHQYRSLRTAGRELSHVSREFALVGGLFTAGMIADANLYVKAVGQTTQIGSQWIESNNRIKASAIQIGQTTASIMLPAMQQTANVVQGIANIVQANPWMVSTALAAGGVLTAVGTLGMIVSQAISMVANAGLLVEKITGAGQFGALVANTTAVNANTAALTGKSVIGGGEGAAAGGGIAAIAGTVGSVLLALGLGVGVGAGGYQAFASATGKPGLNQFATVGAYELGEMFGKISGLDANTIKAKAEVFAAVIGKITGAINENSPLMQNALGDIKSGATSSGGQIQQSAFLANQQQVVNDFIAYQDQIKKTTDTYEQARADTIAQYEQQIAETTQNYEEQRANEVSNFQRQQAQENAKFALQQREAVQKHNLEMQQLAQDEQMKIFDLASKRDALGLAKEKVNYNLQVSQKNAQFALEQQQQQANHALQMQQNAANEQVRLAEMDKQHKKEMDKLATQEKDRLQKMDDQYKKQISDYQTAFVDKINAIDAAILGDSKAYTTYLETEAQQFQSWIRNFQAQGTSQKVYATSGGSVGSSVLQAGQGWTSQMTNTITPHQAGGYITMAGPGEDGRAEWMASNPTSTTLENMIGARLTQQNVIAAVAAGRMNGGAAGHMVSIVIQGKGLTVSEVRQISSENLNMKLNDLIPSWGA